MSELIVLLALARTAAAAFFSWPFFSTRRFSVEGLIDMGSLGLDQGMVAAVGDVEGNQLLDLFVLSRDQRSVSVYLWDRKAYTFERSVAPAIQAPSDFVITNVVPGDYNYDGRLDVLLMGQSNPGGWTSNGELKMAVFFGQGNGAFSEAHNVPSATTAQPIVFDASGDMRADLLGFTADAGHAPRLWRNSWSGSVNASGEVFQLDNPPFDATQFNCKMSDPHSSAFVDLDGDCLADLFLTCVDPTDSSRLIYQIWLNSKSAGFSLARSGSLPPGTGQVAFADMDRDGTMDMTFVACSDSGGDCALYIAYNKQMPLCSGSPSQVGACRNPQQLCTADSNFQFDLTDNSSNDALTKVLFKDLIPDAPFMVRTDSSFAGSLPNSVRLGDYNQDGYPDLLLVTSAIRSASQGAVGLFQSHPCDNTCTFAARKAGRRTFRKVTSGAEVLQSISDAKSASFIDIDEDGSLDLLVQRGIGSGSTRRPTFIKNNYYHDAFFLKALVVNGACEGYCQPEEPGQPRYHPYGVSYSGASYKFTVQDPSGVRRATQVGQLPQTSYLNLLTPYSYFGLGRTNNYVEALFVGSTRHQLRHYTVFEGLIPNSQVVIVPYQAQGSVNPGSWTRRLFLHPGDWIPWVTVAVLGALLVLGTIVLVLHLREKAIDAQERRKQQRLLNFDALG